MFGNKYFSLLFLSLALGLGIASTSFAAVKDTDTDGLTDGAEHTLYHTDATKPDTDGDGIADGQEVLAQTNPLAQDTVTVTQKATPWAWYFGRSSGILAFILLTIVVINGLLISTRLVFHFLPPALNYEMHRFLAWMALLTVIGHFTSFTFDSYFHLTFLEGLVPFMAQRNFTSAIGANIGIAVGLGTLGFYIILSQIITSELKNKIVSQKTWRKLHYLSFVGYLLFLFHGIAAGTDSQTWWMIFLYSLSGALVGTLTFLRILASVRKIHANRAA
jgi:predicted ferric reductase